jgi:D-proline reductase (dithiol) PrdB
VGLIQRVVEAAGIATISISLSKELTRRVKPPRAVYTGFPMGHPLSYPGQSFRQIEILRILLKHLQAIDSPGCLVELDLTENNDPRSFTLISKNRSSN